MNRFRTLVSFVLVCLPVLAEDPPKKLTPEQHTELETKWKELTKTGIKAYQVGKFSDALKSWEDALKLAHQLYNVAEFPDGHKNLANSLNNLAALYFAEGKYAAAESYYKEALATYNRLSKGEDFENVAAALNNLAALYRSQGKYSEAEPLTKEALAMYKRLSKGEDRRDLAGGLNYLALLYWSQGRLAEAEPLYKDALAIYKRLSKGEDNPELANSLNNLALLYRSQGKLAEAEPLYKDTLTMYKRLSKGEDHREVANSLSNLASLYETQDKYTDAEPLYKDALDMYKRLLKNKDHPELARSLSKLASLYCSQGKYAEAEPLYMEAVAMYKRLFKGEDHPDLARSLNGLVDLFYSQGKYVDAETLCKEVLAMRKRLFKDEDNAEVASSLNHLGNLNDALGKYTDAEPLYKDALASYRRLTTRFARDKAEGEALTLLANQPLTRDSFLACTWSSQADPMRVYPEVWLEKGYVARIYEQRQLRTRAASADPRAGQMLSDLIAARRRRAELLLAPKPRDPATRDKRDEEIATLDQLIEEKTRELKKLLPALECADKLAAAKLDDLQKVLPSNVTVVDFLRFVQFQYDKDKPGKQGQTRTPRYLVFVLTREKVTWVDLGTAETIEAAVNAWREAITGNKEIPEAIPAKVRELVWANVRKELPSAITTVYICPDAALCKVPFAALPGDKLGTILLEDYALATIPHAPFLLDKLWPQDPLNNPPSEVLVVGGVKYDVELKVREASPSVVTSRGDPLLKPDQKLGWSFLPNTVGEATGVGTAALRQKFTVTPLREDKATTGAVLAALPKAKYAHFATHGFFADASFRSVFQLDEKDFEKSQGGERIGRAANSPLVMTGLVFAGANNPKTPGRGIVTGEALIDLDLSGLELAVLSACETGLGDVAGGEGTFGLQRAFHMAGTRNVVVSLWKVPDQPTAALMALFYRNLWNQNLSPMESLRQAQLEIYRNPGKIPELAKGFRGTFQEVASSGGEIKPGKDGKAHPLLWAAFTLSGPGR